MEQADADGGGEAGAAGLDRGQVAGHLEDVLERLEEAAAGDLDAEATGAGERFDHAAATEAAYQGLESEL